MALTFSRLFAPTVLGTAETTLYTCPASPASNVIKNGRVRFTNTSGAAATVTAHAVPLAGTAAAANCFLNAESIAPNAHLDVDFPTLAAGDVLSALASAATSITATEIGGVLFS
jgi:hypothetical protein